jgi:LemA protein
LAYNTAIKTFPGVLFANIFHFKPDEFFAATEAEKKEVKVQF